MGFFWQKPKPVDGTKITREYIMGELHKLWPALVWGKTTGPGEVWLADADWLMPGISDVKNEIETNTRNLEKYIPKVRDCDDFAAMLSHDIGVGRHKEASLPWPFWECWVTKLNGKKTVHAVNLVLTMQGLYFIEPQRDTIRQADGELDMPYFIR